MIYVLSDIHGNERRFRSILRQIRLGKEDTLYILGDVIDRHPGGIRILRQIMAAENMKMLLGNHEYMMLRALGRSYDHSEEHTGRLQAQAVSHWYRNGGKVTHDHFKRLRKATREEIIRYLLELPLQIELPGYCLVHAASPESFVTPSRYLNAAHFAVWNRWQEVSFPDRDSILVFGHTPTRHYRDCDPMEIFRGENAMAIDCGSGYPEGSEGRLACVRLDDGKVFYSDEGYVE